LNINVRTRSLAASTEGDPIGSIVLMLSDKAITKTLLWERLQADGKKMADSSNRHKPKHLKKRRRDE
jgi:hypothetical protein